jgi:hypothetical protein
MQLNQRDEILGQHRTDKRIFVCECFLRLRLSDFSFRSLVNFQCSALQSLNTFSREPKVWTQRHYAHKKTLKLQKPKKKKTTEHTISRRISPENMHQIGSQIQAGKKKREESEKQKMLTNSSPNPRDAP